MMTTFTLREMRPSDGAALQRLMGNDPESPGMSLTTRFLVDPYTAWTALKPDLLGVVAEAADTDELVGTATVSFETIQFEGRALRVAHLENLKVHHAYRGQGLGTRLAQWRIERAQERYGADVTVMSGTTKDNTPSLATMKKWCNQFFGPLRVLPHTPRFEPPPPLAGISIRPATPDDYPAIVQQSNQFYADYNLYPPLTVDSLAARLGAALKVYDYQVAVDAQNRLVAGTMISERARLLVDEFVNAPPEMRPTLPPDGILRALEVGMTWFEDVDAARQLWQTIRWAYRERVNNPIANYDPRGPLAAVFETEPGPVPPVEIVLAIRAPLTLNTDRLLCGHLRG